MQRDAAFVIGMGEVGSRLGGALERSGWTVRPVTRTSGWNAALDFADPAPRILAMREGDLAAALDRFPDDLRDRLVLVQNGFLEPTLGDLGPVGRGLIWFTSKAEFFRVLRPSPFHGPHAGRLAVALRAGGIEADLVEDDAAFRAAMIVKGIWNCVVGLPLAVRGVDLATYLGENRDEVEALVTECTLAAGAWYRVAVSASDARDTLLATAGDLGWMRGGAKALEFRNGAVARMGRETGVPTPLTDALLAAVSQAGRGSSPAS